MNKFIVFTVLLTVWGAGAEPPQFRTFKYQHPAAPAQQQFGQQQAAQTDGYSAAGPPSGQLLLLPGEYVVQVNSNSPYREYGVPEQPQYVQPAMQPVVGQFNYQPAQQQFAAQDPNYYSNGQQYNSPAQFNAQPNAFQPQQSNQQGEYNSPAQFNAQPNAFQPEQSGQQSNQQGQFNAPATQFGQYNAQPEFQQQQFGQRVANKPVFSGQLKVQPGKFSGQLNAGEEFEDEADDQEAPQEPQPQVKSKNQRGNVKYNKAANQPETVDEQYQQGRYVQRGNSRYTSPKSQVEYLKQNQNQQGAANAESNDDNDDDSSEADDDNQEFSGKYTQQSGKYTAGQQEPQYTPSRTFFFGRYTQSSEPQQANVQSEYSKVNKYTPPSKYLPGRGKTTTKTPESSTTEESYDSSTTEVATTNDNNSAKENYTNEEKENSQEANGFYYLLLPDGKLQKIVYMTEEDLKKMAFVARLQYQNVEPIQGPVYSYNPQNSPFVQVF